MPAYLVGFMVLVLLALAGMLAGWLILHSRQLLRQELLQDSLLHESLHRAVDDAVLILDTQQQILFANQAAATLLGPDIEGKRLNSVISSPELEILFQDAQVVGGEGMERRIECQHQVLRARAVVLQNNTNHEVVTLRDVTEFQRLERARREMVSNISHELSTPITAIGLLADTIIAGLITEKPKRLRKMLADIRREVDTLGQLVQEMRDLSLIESGQMPIRLTPINLSLVVQASIEQLLSLAENKSQSITVEVPPGVQVLADELQIQRAIKNILHNAIKFSPQAEQIQVSATVANDEVFVSVKDNGPGIPAEDLPRIFERFYQVDRARRHGTGLGLAIVRHIVVAHGGRIWAESTEGQGATFFFTLALADASEHKQARPGPNP